MSPNIVGAKFGDRSCTLTMEVMTDEAFKPSAIVINAKHTYGRLPTNVMQANKHPGIKCATILLN